MRVHAPSPTSIDVNSYDDPIQAKHVVTLLPRELLMEVPNNNIEEKKCQNTTPVGKRVIKVTMGQDAVLMALLGT